MNKKKSLRRGVALILATMLLLCMVGCQKKEKLPAMADPVDDNYRTFYQIFVGSFSDSDGDGYGDLQGVIDRFDYLNDGNMNSETSLGVQGIWLSPIFTSSSYHKYDAIDYYTVDSRFGTEDTLKELADLCESRNVKLILDLVLNHTSNKHPWFLEFKKARLAGDTDNKYYDYYTCVTAGEKVGGRTYQSIGDGWYYECNFSTDMPELNFDNEAVRQEMLDVAKYYLALGIDGFRFDAVKYIYYGDAEKSVAFWQWYMDELKKIDPEIYCVGECWSGESEILQFNSAMNCFNFAMSGAESVVASAAKGNSLSRYTSYIVSYQQKLLQSNPESMAISFLSNHDQDRIAGTFITENNMRMAANLYLLSPGSPVIYYGEEIGMRGSRGSAQTDANRRLAMLWGDGDTVKNPTGTTYAADKQIKTTVADQMKDENSLLRYYCKLLSIRHRYPAIARGEYEAVATSEQEVGGFLIRYQEENLVVLHNNSTEQLQVDLNQCQGLQDLTLTQVCEVIGVGKVSMTDGVLTIDGMTSVVIR